jgi:hypothetical protein
VTSRPALIIGGVLIAVTAASMTLAVTLLTTGHDTTPAPARVIYATATATPAPAISRTHTASPAPSPSRQERTTPAPATAPAPDIIIGSFTGREPDTIDFSGDAGNVVTGIRWTAWDGSGATGYGVSGVESCDPDCASGNVTEVSVTVTLSSPSGGTFTVMTETKQGSTSTWYYPGQWASGAS